MKWLPNQQVERRWHSLQIVLILATALFAEAFYGFSVRLP